MNINAIPQNVRHEIDQIEVDEEKLKTVFLTANTIMDGWNPLESEENAKWPAIVQAERVRLYFNQRGIPVAFTAQNFEGFAYSTLLKTLNAAKFDKEKGLKFWQKVNADEKLEVDNSLCACTCLFDATHGESHIFYLRSGTQSYRANVMHQIFGKVIREAIEFSENTKAQIIDLVERYNQELMAISGDKLLYTIALIAEERDKLMRYSKGWDDHFQQQPGDLNNDLLKFNNVTKITSQSTDCPQLRIKKPEVDKDEGTRMFICYQSDEQKTICHQFKEELRSLIKK